MNNERISGLYAQIRGPFDKGQSYSIPSNYLIDRIAIHLAHPIPLEHDLKNATIITFDNSVNMTIGSTGMLELDSNMLFLNDLIKLQQFKFNKAQPGDTLVELWLRNA